MRKTQIIGALGLALALGVIGGNSDVYAEETATATIAIEQRSAGTDSLAFAANNVKEVLRETENVNISKYPGVRDYLQGLVDESERAGNQGSQELADALNEGALATSLLMGTYNKQNTTKTAETVAEPAQVNAAAIYAVQTEVKETEVVPVKVATSEPKSQQADTSVKLANTSVKVTVADSAEESGEELPEQVDAEKTDENQPEEVANTTNEDEIEVPKTGEVKTNLGVLVVAGVCVVGLTLGATAVILKGKKNA